MIERIERRAAPDDLEVLTQKAIERQARHRRLGSSTAPALYTLANLATLPSAARRLPSRYLTHAIVALLLPVAIGLNTAGLATTVLPRTTVPAAMPADLAPAPLSITREHLHGQYGAVVGDAPLDENDAMPVPLTVERRSEALAPLVVPAVISGDEVKMRTGPGTEYDELGKMLAGTALQVTGRSGDWVLARLDAGSAPFWVSSELVSIAPAAAAAIGEARDIPAPPPPKVAQVIENNLNLRDGPGTNYIGIAKMSTGQDLTLIERYVNGSDDWFHVVYGEDEGWVSAGYLVFQPGVAERIPITNEIPDPNPALLGTIKEGETNLRKGPGSSYDRVGQADADSQVELLARHKDWVKVATGDGTKAWVFSDLLSLPARVWRRVPETNDIPAAPRRTTLSNQGNGGGGGGGGGGAVASLPVASGDVSGFAAQFAGYPYAWGGMSPAGFDCSGLMAYAYGAFGISLPRTAAAQYYNTPGARISDMGSLAPGDLVFFAGTAGPGITHVGMYIGGGQLVHAMTPAYGVGISNIYESYWVGHFYGAVRPYR